jgi:hypothetical protein
MTTSVGLCPLDSILPQPGGAGPPPVPHHNPALAVDVGYWIQISVASYSALLQTEMEEPFAPPRRQAIRRGRDEGLLIVTER